MINVSLSNFWSETWSFGNLRRVSLIAISKLYLKIYQDVVHKILDRKEQYTLSHVYLFLP